VHTLRRSRPAGKDGCKGSIRHRPHAEPYFHRISIGLRNIGDFTRWKEHDAYTKALNRLLRDLRVEKG
jgi:hypothetical protein